MLLSVLRGLMRRPSLADGSSGRASSSEHLARGLEHQVAGRLLDAETDFRRALAADPEHVHAAHLLGMLLLRSQRTAEALVLLERAAALAPDDAAVHSNLGSVYLAQDAPTAAMESFERAVRAEPGLAAAHSNLGNVCKQLGELGRAEACYRRALEISPDLAEAWHNLGNLQRELGDEAASLESFDRALALDPGLLEARYSRALALLGSGDLARGWEEHEVRWALPRRARDRRDYPYPYWHGETLDDRSILVWSEQGIGDEILFAGMYAELQARAGRCVFECSAKLAALFARSFPAAQVVARTAPAHPAVARGIDYQIAAGSLARHLRPALEAFPLRGAYLRADPLRVDQWRARIGALGTGLKIGFSWRSADRSGERALASSALEQWRAVFAVPGVHWVALQYDECGEELARARTHSGVILNRYDGVDYFDDLDEVSALTAALDLVISAPNTVGVHAAALGVEVWQLTCGADWQTHGTHSVPWYPTLRRFPRAWQENWEDVIARVAAALRARSGGAA